ncbi:carboxy terminal-processing peptidase [Isoalcanivorax beigongshangi]|uniref:Carboxy terminal-processing peptidase n=1 Tax=Isoalcanivorax beigongshangi TaxID=3238810 RepID=A0ABV4AHD5_9GAMM
MTQRPSSLLQSAALVLLLAAGALQVSGAFSRDTPPATAKAAEQAPGMLQPEPVHAEAARAILDRLRSHYQQLPVDEQLSSQMFDRYLRDLDANRVYFLASDLSEFEPLRSKLVTDLRRGTLTSGYRIFNRYQQRLEERLDYLLAKLEKGFDELDFDSAETLMIDRSEQPWPADSKAMDTLWDQRLKNAVLSMRLDGVADDEIQTRLARRYRSQLSRVRQNTAEDVFQVYMNALTQVYDPHTSYFSPVTSENFNISMSRSLEGIGAVLQADDEYTKVVRLVPGGPAAKAGQLKPADRVVGVGQEKGEIVNVIGWRLDEVVNLIRGPKGSKVRLEIIPAGSNSEHTTREVVIERNKVMLEEQAAKKLILDIPAAEGHSAARIGVIRLPAFYLDFDAYNRGEPDYTSTTRDVARLLGQLEQDKQGIDGLVIDLRNNGGGSLLEATQLVSLFIDGGPTVQVRDARGRVQAEQDRVPGALYRGPMAVLVNRFSASASEIFAGAMQDYGRALIIGDDTFGKGTVQTLLPLPHGQLKLTQAKFYRISGSSNQNLGITPDLALPFLIDKQEIGESALPNALPWDQIPASRYRPLADLSGFIKTLTPLHDQRVRDNPEFQYVRAQQSLLNEQRARKVVSLNEAERRKEQQEFEQRQLTLENTRRAAAGEDALKDYAALRALDEQRALDPEGLDDDTDAYLLESGAVVADLAQLMRQQPQVVQRARAVP